MRKLYAAIDNKTEIKSISNFFFFLSNQSNNKKFRLIGKQMEKNGKGSIL